MSEEAPGGVKRFEQFVTCASPRRRAAVAFVAGAVSVLAFAPFHLFPVLFFTFPVFFWQIDASRTPRAAAIAGWWAGFGYFLFNLFWIGEAFLVEADKFAWLLPFAVTLLPAGIALFWAAGWAAAKAFWPNGSARLPLFALQLGLVEWLRGHLFTGLPWNVPGYALTFPLELMQSAALFGVYALSFIAGLIFTSPLVLCAAAAEKEGRRGALFKAALLGLAPFIALYAYGAYRLNTPTPADIAGLKVRIVQPSVAQRDKWRAEKQREIFADHLALSATDSAGTRDDLKGVTHVVWPEAAMPFLPLEHPEALEAIAGMLPDQAILVTGALRRAQDQDGRMRGYNSLMAFDTQGKLIATYDKVHLVPFGEYLPFERVLKALGLSKLTHGLGAFDAGPLPRPVLAVPDLPPVGGLVCYEVLFPGEVIDDANRPGLIINVTNDGWFGDTTGPRQHFHQTRVRAVEEGIPVIRAANNGISAVIDAFGGVRARIGLNVRGVADSSVPAALPAPLYAQLRGLVFWSFAGALLLAVVLSRRE